ncbi:olfactory receptor 12-like [Protobothrops mucrosquamatus]|uniref:olfactory receptor 12-like n=1 Tax=Protobothrops mucrosquamatus TaxID=103944 RepID=UPI000775DA3B|nr:olfactory receptor 12-like [Protobothrops mucrosquamatus]
MENCSTATEFVLVGFRDQPKLEITFFTIFLVLYITTLIGNGGMITIINADPKLHTPMYYFIRNLSFLDLCYSSAIAPKALANFLEKKNIISYEGCVAQLMLFTIFVTTEGFLLAVMAYDRFIAICYPLLYPLKMSKTSCHHLVVSSYICGCANGVIQTTISFHLRFCNHSKINHFFCDVPAVMNAAMTNTYINEAVMFSLCNVIIALTTGVIFTSYAYILSTILKMHSADGRQKAFSTCASHITAVVIFYGTVFFIYAQPAAISSPFQSKIVSVFYTLVIPMLNPLIYSLRNKDVKNALRRTLGRRFVFMS